jgi:FtsP/CotA-like multicopper oxidase with cupredoxin domain
MKVSRREALAMGAFGALGAAGLAAPIGGAVQAATVSSLAPANMPRPYVAKFARPRDLPFTLREDADGLFKLFTVTQRLGSANIVPGLKTPVFGYEGMVPGPTIKVEQGMRVKLRVRNQLPALHPKFGHAFNTSTHLHGSASLPQYDGYADDVTHVADYKDYVYPNWQPARTLWYHDHNVHTTAENAYSGLAAQYHLSDPAEKALLPQGDYDVPVTITDAMFAADGSLAYDDRNHSGLMGDVILVNGQPWPVMQVKRKIYRFRVLNASISRSLRLSLSNRAALHMVATDGGLMPKTQPVVEYRHAGAERYEFLIDFSKVPAGTNVDLLNASNKNNVDYDNTNKVMRFRVTADGVLPPDAPGSWTPSTVPDTLVPSEAMSLREDEVTGGLLRLRLERDDVTNLFQISGRSWHDVTDSGYQEVLRTVQPDEVQEWEIENRTNGGWFHPLHIHLVDFQIISRNGQPAFAWEKGPKDVVYVGEDETVRVRMKFSLQKGGGNSKNAGGRYMIHCHNLPHEDHDMMHQFAVGDPYVNDPIASAPCQPDDGKYDDGWEPAGPAAVAPGAPLIGPATAGNGSATVTWTPPASDGGSPITGYWIRVVDAAGATFGNPWAAASDATSLVVGGLTNGQTYRFDVTAGNAVGTSNASGLSPVVTPRGLAAAPTAVAAVAGNASATVRWTAPADNGGSALTSYEVEVLRGATVQTTVRGVPATSTSTLVPSLTNGVAYSFRVRAMTSAGTGALSTASNVVTPSVSSAPPSVTARTPASFATGVALTANVTVTFSTAVTGVSTSTVTLHPGADTSAAPVAAAVTYNATSRVATLNPSADLAVNTQYTARLTPGITSTSGAPLAAMQWSFRTRV